ncbi:acyltransferase family protein [Bradyrhizobium sp. CCBAU 51627]|uniref:acyltransferase family protein n=1 Tax=Bradyrhizobium sp. CCBAU 51627 TaxID=1325088 RepID=UPI0023058E2F|nr:acyltransferase [Bradyrhizobium sp. CCBAU 51627]
MKGRTKMSQTDREAEFAAVSLPGAVGRERPSAPSRFRQLPDTIQSGLARYDTAETILAKNNGLGPGFNMMRHLLSLVILSHHCRVAVAGLFAGAAFVKKLDEPGMAVFVLKDPAAAAFDKMGGLTALSFSHLQASEIIQELLRPGLIALVGMFFALSGFLVTGSAIKNPDLKTFFINRVLRIVPALSVEVTLCALVVGPLLTQLPLSQYLSEYQFYRYFGNIAGHVTFELPGLFLHNPWPEMVNANLWTLPWELWCYVFAFALLFTHMISSETRKVRWITLLVGAALVAELLAYFIDPATFNVRSDSTRLAGWYLVFMFFFGIVFRLNARYVPIHWTIFAISAACYAGIMWLNVLLPLAGIFLTYCTVYIGMQSFKAFDSLFRQDLSYGIYLYGFPITQATIDISQRVLGSDHRLSLAVILPIVVMLTLGFASFSWNVIEKPALRLRRFYQRPA